MLKIRDHPKASLRADHASEMDLASVTFGRLVPQSVLGEALIGKVAVSRDGYWLFARGYLSDPAVNRELDALLTQGAIPPPSKGRLSVTMDRLEAMTKADMATTASTSEGDVSRSIMARCAKLLNQCARVEASDVRLLIREGTAHWSAIVHDRMEPLGEPWSADDGRLAIRCLFYAAGAAYANDGAGRDIKSYKCSAEQVREAGLDLPDGITALRIATAGNEPGDGLHMVARLFYRRHSTQSFSLKDIITDEADYRVLEQTMLERKGALIIVGATGDGKSTTGLKYIETLHSLAEGRINIVELGNPVEQISNPILQISAEDSEDRSTAYVDWIRHFMRLHPHAGFIQEIRDLEAAKLFHSFVLSGHPGVTTLHGSSANSALFRLMTMGMRPEELASPDFARFIMRQTLVWELCDCALPADDKTVPSPVLRSLLNHYRLMNSAKVRNAAGCPKCRRDDSLQGAFWHGFNRIRAVCEYIHPDPGWLEYVQARDEAGAYRWWLTHHHPRTLAQRLRDMVARGRLDPIQAAAKGAFIGEAGKSGKIHSAKRSRRWPVERSKRGSAERLDRSGDALRA